MISYKSPETGHQAASSADYFLRPAYPGPLLRPQFHPLGPVGRATPRIYCAPGSRALINKTGGEGVGPEKVLNACGDPITLDS